MTSPCKIETFASCPTGTESPSWSGSSHQSRQSRAAAEPDLDNYLFVIHFEFEPVLVLVWGQVWDWGAVSSSLEGLQVPGQANTPSHFEPVQTPDVLKPTSCSLEAGKVRSSEAFLLKTPQVRLFWNNGFLVWDSTVDRIYTELMPGEYWVGDHSKTEHVCRRRDAAQKGILRCSVIQLKDWLYWFWIKILLFWK